MLRWAEHRDFDALGRVMFAAIHADPSPYTVAQRHAWCPAPPSGPGWENRLAAQHVAVVELGQPVGMLTLRGDGYLDLAYLLPEARGAGHLRAMMAMIIGKARELGLRRITTHASLSAQAPFAALGFTIAQHETIERDGQALKRAEMRLDLEKAGPSERMR